MSEWLNDDGYPTEEALTRITWAAPADVIRFMLAAWNQTYGSATTKLSRCEAEVASHRTDKLIRLATGGWSGNEEVVGAYKRNHVAFSLTWRLSAAGGLHILSVIERPEGEAP